MIVLYHIITLDVTSDVSKLAGIAVDEEGYSFVAENHYYSGSYTTTYGGLYIFNPYQRCIIYLNKFEYAKGVTIDREGYFYVTSARDIKKTAYKYWKLLLFKDNDN